MARKGPITPPDATHRVVILHGKEAFLRAEYTNQLADKLRAEHGELDRIRYDGDPSAAGEILDECRSFGLMAPHKLIVVDDADRLLNESTRPLFERYADSPCDGATLVLRAQTWRAGRLDKAVAATGVVTPCEEASEPVATRWASRRAAKAHDAQLPPESAAALIARVGTDLARLDSELAKLAAAAGPAPIGTDLIAELVGQTKEEEVWSIQAELLSGDPERTVAHLRSILDHAPRDAHVPVTFACTDLARKLHAASHAVRQGQNPGQIAKALRLWGPSRDAVLHAARWVEPDRARALLDACVDADRAGKSGLGRPSRTLERLALRFAALNR